MISSTTSTTTVIKIPITKQTKKIKKQHRSEGKTPIQLD